jgi:hypothetical protein
MRFYSFLSVLFLTAVLFLAFPSCKKNKCGESNISVSGGSKSHNFGQNCMNCHKSGGEGEGCFNAAGSVSNASTSAHLTGGTMKLYTGPNGTGTLKYTVAIDSKGNFYTTESVEYSGLYPAITGTSGNTNYMGSTISTGACNSCHGSSTGNLYAD